MPPRRYDLLSDLALKALAETGDLDRVAAVCRESGAEAAREYVSEHPEHRRLGRDELVEAIREVGDEVGMLPEVGWEQSTLAVDVRNCVFKELSSAQPDLVCVMHRAFLEGFIEQLAGAGGEAAIGLVGDQPGRRPLSAAHRVRLTDGRPPRWSAVAACSRLSRSRDTVPAFARPSRAGNHHLMQLDDLTADLLDATIRRALRHGGDFAEVFVEDRRSLGLSLEDRRVERAAGGRESGFGVRLTSGDRTYYSYSDDLSEADLQHAADAVSAALRGGAGGAPVTDLGAVREAGGTASIAVPPASVATDVKAGLLRAADEAARAASPAVSQVSAGYLESRQRLLVANSLGAFVADDRTRVRFTVSAVARRDGVIQTGYESLGKSLGFEILDEGIAQTMARAAAGKAVTMLDARPAPTGPMAVVMGNGFGGTLFHEACGHGLEADGIAKGSSIYEGKMGDLVASTIVTAYDDGTIAGEWGSASVDDEGAPTQNTVVIEEGRLRGFLYDGLRAREKASPKRATVAGSRFATCPSRA